MATELASKPKQYVLSIIQPNDRPLSQMAAYYTERLVELRKLLPVGMSLSDEDTFMGTAFVTGTSEDCELLQSRIDDWATLIHRKRRRVGGL